MGHRKTQINTKWQRWNRITYKTKDSYYNCWGCHKGPTATHNQTPPTEEERQGHCPHKTMSARGAINQPHQALAKSPLTCPLCWPCWHLDGSRCQCQSPSLEGGSSQPWAALPMPCSQSHCPSQRNCSHGNVVGGDDDSGIKIAEKTRKKSSK